MNGELRSLNFDGVGKCRGGSFDEVNISGVGKIDGDIKCNKFNSLGCAKVIGTTECEEFFTAGISKMVGNIFASNLDISGTLKCTGDIYSTEINSGGMIHAEGNLKSDVIKGNGYLKVNQSIECESININGIVECGKFLNCEEITINLNGISSVNEIGASSVNISKGHGNYYGGFNILKRQTGDFEKHFSSFRNLGILSIKKFAENKLVANTIEADEISLENSAVKVLRGKNIKIGKGCYIEHLEYSESVEIDDNSEVSEINKI